MKSREHERGHWKMSGCRQRLAWPDHCGQPIVKNGLCSEHRDMTVKGLLKERESLKGALRVNESQLASFGVDGLS